MKIRNIQLRTKKPRKSRGFTLIELVLVIAILGVLAVSALPCYFTFSLTTARTNAMLATVGAVQAGISLYAASQLSQGNALSYPATLDSASAPSTASVSVRLFSNVLQNGVSNQWFKESSTIYAYDTPGTGTYSSSSDTCFVYSSSAGTFLNTTCP